MLRKRVRLLNKAAQTTTVTGDVVNVSPRSFQRATGRIKSNAISPGTLSVKIQHNDDPGDTNGWKDLITFTQQTNATGANGVEDVHVPFVTTNLYPHVRAVATIGSSGSYTFTVDLWLD